MKAKPLTTEQEKIVAKAIEDGYVMEDDKSVSLKYEASEYFPDIEEENPVIATGFAKQDITELPTVIKSPDTDAEMAIPFDTPPKEIRLHKKPLSVLTNDLEHMRKSFSNKNGGMRGIPKSVRNRIKRLEKVIDIKTEIYKRALEHYEHVGKISEDT